MDRFNPDYPLYKYACFVTSKINDSDICAYQTWLGFFDCSHKYSSHFNDIILL